MQVKVEVRGVEQLRAELSRLDAAVATRLSRNACMAAARVAARHARILAPVGSTGNLKRSIKARRPRDRAQRGQAIAFANASIWYAHFLEYGTVHAAAKPFMRPAVDANLAEIEQKLIENLGRGIDREIAKLPTPEDPGEQ